MRDGCLAERAFRRLLEPTEETQVVKVSVLARDYLAGLGDALEADDAAFDGIFLCRRYLFECALEDLAFEVVA